MKLNSKGYLTIEIILASVVAFAIAFFLIEITVKLVTKTDDIYNDILFYTEKAKVTKDLKGMIEADRNNYGKIIEVTEDCHLNFSFENKEFSNKMIAVDPTSNALLYGPSYMFDTEKKDAEGINYTNIDNSNLDSMIFLNDTNNDVNVNSSLLGTMRMYPKIINTKLILDSPKCTCSSDNNYIFIKIPLSNVFSETDKYDINIVIDNNSTKYVY